MNVNRRLFPSLCRRRHPNLQLSTRTSEHAPSLRVNIDAACATLEHRSVRFPSTPLLGGTEAIGMSSSRDRDDTKNQIFLTVPTFMRTLCSEEAALADRSIVLVPPGARDTFRLEVNVGDLPVRVICVAHKDGTPGVRGVAPSHEAYAVVLLEVVSLSAVCEFLPCLEQDLESVGYFYVIAFHVGV